MVLFFIRYNCNSGIEKILLKTGLGFGVVGNLIMLLNFLNLASGTGIQILVIILTVLSIPFFFKVIKWTLNCKHNKFLLPAITLPFTVSVFLLSLYFIRSLLPPSGFDALMYHLSTVKLFLKKSGFFHIFFNPQSDFPMLTEMNFMTCLAFGNDIVCRQIDFLFGVLACGSLYLNCKTCNLTHKESFICLSIFLTMTVVIASFTSCDVDMAMAAWISLSVYMARKSLLENSFKALVISSFFAGMALETKIFGIFVLPLLLCTILFYHGFKWRRLVVFMILPLIMALPWYIKSYINRGTIISINTDMINDQGLGLPMGLNIDNSFVSFIINTILRIAISPWSFSIMPSQHQQDTFGPLFIAILPFAFFINISKESRYLLTVACVYVLTILLMEIFFIPGGSSIRYSIVVPLFLIPVCLHILKNLKNCMPAMHKLLCSLLSIQITLGALLLVKRYHTDWIALITNKTRDQYYESIIPQYPAIKFINELPDTNTVMPIYNFYNYLIDKPYICSYRNYSNSKDIDDFDKFGISYIFANNPFDTLSNGNAFPQLNNKQIIFSGNGFYVYKVKRSTF